ncbi:pyridoxal phosphate-dependent aminotransferase [Anaerolineales bacterium]
MARYANRVASFSTTIFSEINILAAQFEAINLGQGKPNFDGASSIVESAIHALASGSGNQYAPGLGTHELRVGIANHAQHFYQLSVDPKEEVLVTAGATEAVFSSIMGLVDAGDEVIIIDPFFDSYAPGVMMAGAKPVFVPLHPPLWQFAPQELTDSFTDKTRAIILNTPHNPTGRVFTREELQFIADLCIQHDVTVISDEVYEHLVYGEHLHIPIATLPDMFERTVTIGSAGKTFGMTGWKIGWVYGPAALMTGVWRAHQFVTFAANHPSQNAVADAFLLGDNYYNWYQQLYTKKRDMMMQALDSAGLKSIAPEGTYFVVSDFSEVFKGTDREFSTYLIKEIGVACIPTTAFFTPEHHHITDQFVRFSFCKTDELLALASTRLAKLKH